MKISTVIFLISATFIFPGRLFALGLDDCVKMAVANSRALKAYGRLSRSSEQAYKSAKASLRPALSASGESDYTVYQGGSGLRDGLLGQAGVQLSLDLRKTLAGAELERLDTEKSGLEAKLAEKDIIRGVTQDYYKLYILLKKRDDYDEAVKYFQSHIEDIEKLEHAGMDLKLDRVRAEIQLNSLEVARRALDADMAAVLKSLSSAAGKDLKAEEMVFDDGPALLEGLSGREERPAAGSAAPLLSFSVRLNRLETASAFEAYRRTGFVYAPALQFGLARNISPIDPAMELYRTYLAVSLDVFDWGARAGGKQAALEAYRARVETEAENKRQLALSLAQLGAGMRSAASVYDALRSNYLSAAGNLETAKTYYRQGKIKETDLLSIFSEYLAAKEQSRDALGLYLDKKTELEYLRAGETE